MREKILFDNDWLFHRGDIDCQAPRAKGPIYSSAKTEHARWGPASKYYPAAADDYSPGRSFVSEKWESIKLPHDYIISQTPCEDESISLGYFKYTNAWYRKSFTLSPEDKDRHITLLFEGIATSCTVYINGITVKHNFSGYNSFEVDITDFVRTDSENILAVYVSTADHESWWYAGGGIYRHVWLIKTEQIAVDLWGVYVSPEKKGDGVWDVPVEVTVNNYRYDEAKIKTVCCIADDSGNICTRAENECVLSPAESTTLQLKASIHNPELWDIKSPVLYYARVYIYEGDILIDEYETHFGFRSFYLDADKGFFLNGRNVKIKGVCAHQDFGITGKAVADSIQRHKVKLIKEMGANGYRCSHYPHSEATMDALDKGGLIVMDETRWFSSSEESMAQLEMLVKRDRNRPSVFFWSTGNEEPFHVTDEGVKICRRMKALIRKLDRSRPVMAAISISPNTAAVNSELDVIGVNYNLENFEALHKNHPKKMLLSSECCATGTTRGWYFDSCDEIGRLSAYDRDTNDWFRGREVTWRFIMEHEWIAGAYQWIAFEHRGECLWPRLCSVSGAIDLFLQKKDAFYQNQSHWIDDRSVIHLLPHWNFKGMEGKKIPVFAYTNCEEAELFVNGRSVGKQKTDNYRHGQWTVEYEPGELLVKGYNGGKEVISESMKTSQEAQNLCLRLENTDVTHNGRDVALITCFCTDKNGMFVPDAAPTVRFHTNKNARLLGTGSDNCDHTPVTSAERKMYSGLISVAVELGETDEEAVVYAVNEKMGTVCISI